MFVSRSRLLLGWPWIKRNRWSKIECRSLSQNNGPYSYSVTTPIFYVNGAPHIGHTHTAFLADALNIYHRLLNPGTSTIFSAGTDEHGLKVKLSAQQHGIPCLDFCKKNSDKFKQLFHRHNITITDFIRTTDDNHLRAVEHFWNQLSQNNAIYKSTYEGWYCSNEETFVPESQIVREGNDDDPVHDVNGNRLEWYLEENYMFKLDQYKDEIHSWLRQNEVVRPKIFNQLALSMLSTSSDYNDQAKTKNHNTDISISRPTRRLDWGIRVPNDPDHTIYVWLDALVNYLTAAGYPDTLKRWPVDCHVIGKDILKFHSIYWPAFLLAANMPLPKRIICHSHWLVGATKMSKSRGNVIDPTAEANILSNEGLRYYLLRTSPPHSDSDYNQLQAIRSINSDLADTLGNLISRCCSVKINRKQEIPLTVLGGGLGEQYDTLITSLEYLSDQCGELYQEGNFYLGIDKIMTCLRLANNLFHVTEPWLLVRKMNQDEKARIQHNDVLAVSFECLRICSILLMPIVPSSSRKIMAKMNLNAADSTWKDAKLCLSKTSGPPSDEAQSRSLNGDMDAIIFSKIKV